MAMALTYDCIALLLLWHVTLATTINYKLRGVLAYTNWELPDSVLGPYLENYI